MNSTLKKTINKIPKAIKKDKTRDAVRLALQSGLAAGITFLVMKYFSLPEVFLAVLSAVLVIEPSIGNTIAHSKGRILATVVGCLIGFGLVSAIPYGYATVISISVTVALINLIVGFKPQWRYGIVGAAAIAIGSESDALETSIDRLIAIGIGIVVGFLISLVVWPDKASQRARMHLRKALNAACERFEIALDNTTRSEKKDSDNVADNFHTNLGNAKGSAEAIQWENSDQIHELIRATEKLYNSILIIHRVSQSAASDILAKGADIEEKASEIKDSANKIISAVVNDEEVTESQMTAFKELVEKTKKEVVTKNGEDDDQMFRNAFIFGITEIKESLDVLKDY
ncbi:hypothetical protein G3O08_20330 [Cryomorpha ignava]|uniref:Integral membrane bound transporter domain-containing protein n=1 Tax=Cryomorpha ignava TaxID=101383 RepID=A0A7K3WXK8_9FLAO|nr:FUSC family protein [Cryomorpha ignava]NEN25841.1 hypothetical protein [Cryomorpha ignava]